MKAPTLYRLQGLAWGALPSTVWAAGQTLGQTLTVTIDPSSWLAVLVLSSVAGLASLVGILHREMRAAKPFDRSVALLSIWHMLSSLVIGVLVFLAGESSQMDKLLESCAIAVSALGGARLLDVLIERRIRQVARAVLPTKPGDL